MTVLVKITKREARKRYDSDLPIAISSEPWWFDTTQDYPHATMIYSQNMGDQDFDYVVDISQDTRYKTPRVSFAKPIHDHDEPCDQCDMGETNPHEFVARITRCPECDSPYHYSYDAGECRQHFA